MIQYKGYIGQVEFDADARILHGEVVGIRDVVTFQGSSVEEVEQAFRDSVDDYLAFCKERGEEPDKPCSGNFVVRSDSQLHRQINQAAAIEGTSLNSWVVDRLREAVSQQLSKSSRRKPASSKAHSTSQRKRRTSKPTRH